MDFNIEAIKRKMLVKYPFFGGVVTNVNYKENREISTAGTDGQTIYYNPEFFKELKLDEQTFVFAHEVCHIAFDHIKRSEGKNPKIWNTATDGVINQFLKRDGLPMIEGCVDMADAINYNAEQLYDKLMKEKEQNQEQVNQQNASSSEQSQQKEEQNQDVGHDTHDMWKDAIKREKEEVESNDQQTEETRQQKERLRQEIDQISQIGEKKAFNKNLEEKRKELESLKQVLAEQAMGAGTTTDRNQIIINDIERSKLIIDWRYILREAIQYEVDWSYRNAYIEDGVVSAKLEEQPMPETEILLDTSGSINESLLKSFLRECKNILQHSKVKVGCFDTEFYGFHEIRTEEDIEDIKFEGGGGTNFNVAVRAFTRRAENKIIFTDGGADMPDMPMDAIWIVFGNKRINPPGGKVIQIDEEQLKRLLSLQDMSYKGKSR